MAQAVILLDCTEEVPASNLSWATNYPEVLRGIPQSLPADAGIVR
jgi:hypothetical protein